MLVLMLAGVLFVVAMLLFARRVVREVRADRPAPLESSNPRDAIRAAIERRQ